MPDFAALLPFSGSRERLKNGETGRNGGRSNPCYFSHDHLI
jgi:hypothetical protein